MCFNKAAECPTEGLDITYQKIPTTYNPEIKPPRKVTWPMRFGSPDWAQIPCLQKRTLKAEVVPDWTYLIPSLQLSTDKDFRKHRSRVAYLSLYYN
ncbi:Protein pitchfork [Camelus dromedarius]|uniref:Protein pitchfork n=1 Tax=Camelus dromedarius TaxID=9838 RepID=A0A5N4DS99_CAMDR|nr:Protein pitchfork [Camelus dromedarius]